MDTKSRSERRLFKNLPPVPRQKILAYLQKPSRKAWEEVRDIPVSFGQSLEDVINTLDFAWGAYYPSMILVARASRVIDRRNQDLSALEM